MAQMYNKAYDWQGLQLRYETFVQREQMDKDKSQHHSACVDKRTLSCIDRFFELVEERIAAAEAATRGGHTLIETSSVPWN